MLKNNQIIESRIDINKKWYFGNNRSKNLRIAKPSWNVPFFLTTSYEYAKEYSDYGVYKIELSNEKNLNILNFNNNAEVNKLKWPKILIDKIQDGKNDLNSIAYDMYILAFGTQNELMYIQHTDAWQKAAQYFKEKSKGIFKNIRHRASTWGDDNDHQFLLQMWKDIYDAGFDGFMHIEFGNKVLALFDLKCIDKISVKPINSVLNESKDMGEVSDGYHTFNELYYYRMLYNAAFFNELAKNSSIRVLKSKRHYDGKPPFDDPSMFIVQAELPTGQVSNHYYIEDWEKFNVEEVDVADEWDGHTPQQAAERLQKFILEFQCKDEETFCEYLAHEIVPQKKDILFPDEEIADLSKQKHIVTHRVSDDANRFNAGDIVMTSWGIPYKVSSKLIVDKVEDSPYANDLTPQQLTFLDDFDEIAVLELDAQYEPPYSLEQIKAKYPAHIYNNLANDPVHKWRAETGIELIHKEPTEEELDRIWKNWQLMSQEMKDISDKKSIELFGCTNVEHYIQLKSKQQKII